MFFLEIFLQVQYIKIIKQKVTQIILMHIYVLILSGISDNDDISMNCRFWKTNLHISCSIRLSIVKDL